MKRENIEFKVNNCHIPTKGSCFKKCINFLTGLDYRESYLEFVTNEKRRSDLLTQARVQPCCKASNVNIGYYISKENFPRTVTERYTALYL